MSRTAKRQMLLWGSIFLFAVGLTLHVRQMLFMALVLALLAPLSRLMSRPILRGLQVQRRMPSRLTARQSCRVTLAVENPTARSRPAFWIQDSLPEGLSAGQEAGQLLVDLGPHEQREISYQLRALRRGVFELGPVKLTACDALGLHDFEETVSEEADLLVYPAVVPLPDLWPRGPAERTSPRRTRRRPGGIDPRGTREYVPGDDLRHINWKVSAHRDKLIIVEREQSEGLRATVLLDLTEGVHVGRGNDTTLEYGVTLAASLLVQALNSNGTVGLLAHGNRDYSVPADSIPSQRWRLLEALARVQAGSGQGLSATVLSSIAGLPRGSAVAVITPQAGPEVLTAASLLASRGFRALWFLLVAPSFELERGTTSVFEDRYRQIVQSLVRRGQPTYLMYGGEALEASLRRWRRVAV